MITSELLTTLTSFDPIGPEETGSVSLMNRYETKYLFSVKKLCSLIEILDKKYRIYESENLRAVPYNTTYLDTSGYSFYNQHIRGELERYKVRYRKYESTGDSFLEIKKKTNKGRTIKWRIVNDLLPDFFNDEATSLLKEHLPSCYELIKPVLISRFTRVTLIQLESKERITIDYDLSFSEPLKGMEIRLPYLTVVELKKEGSDRTGPFNKVLKKMNIHPAGFSKYCIGNALLNDSLKKNIMKPKILLLNKIENEHNGSYNN